VNSDTGRAFGLIWETEGESLIPDSVRYVCQQCGAEHAEHHKDRMFRDGEWIPTAQPAEPDIRSYHLPALYSPVGMQPWYKCVSDYLEAFDTVEKRVKDIGRFQVFYNNILAEPFEVLGDKVRFTHVSGHRRPSYRLGQVPNEYAAAHSGGKIQLVTCQVDVHKTNLAVAVTGWTRGARCYLLDYWRFEADDCGESDSPAWARLQEVIEERVYTDGDGREYRVALTLIDSGYVPEVVCGFAGQYAEGVYPIIGRDRPARSQRIQEFGEFKTMVGTTGYRIIVDHYKDRLAPVLRRDWVEEAGVQPEYHFNAAIDTPDKVLRELTVETRREKVDQHGARTWYWHRPGNARNELWDLLVYGHAAVEIVAWRLCVGVFELETIEWPRFWDFLEERGPYWTDKG